MKHFLSILLSLICISNTASAFDSFTDVPSTTWYAPYVHQALNERIIEGYVINENYLTREFRPQNAVTLAEALKMAIETSQEWEDIDTVIERCRIGCPETVGIEHWAKDYLQIAKENAFAVFDENVVLDRPASRRQVAQIVVDAFRIAEVDMSGDPFIDVAMNSKYAAAVHTLKELGITTGDTNANGNPTGYFRPVDTINRAETVKIMMIAKNIQHTLSQKEEHNWISFILPQSATTGFCEDFKENCLTIDYYTTENILEIELRHGTPNINNTNFLVGNTYTTVIPPTSENPGIELNCKVLYVNGAEFQNNPNTVTDSITNFISSTKCAFSNIGKNNIYGSYTILSNYDLFSDVTIENYTFNKGDEEQMHSIAYKILQSIK